LALPPGTRIGPYEVLAPLGAGGMGEVYRARDTKLHRDVAIKALQPAVSADRERITRFEREAQILASLQHPNIGGIYGLEQQAGSTYLVLEFVDGRPLDAILKERGALPAPEALPLAKQIATAMAAAHEKGIIHRDLKPGNVMVNADGQVKVLDFGLGKSIEAASAAAGPTPSNSPTITLGGTQAGIILGTAGYMSPEQAKGRAADRRSDVWSFGCMLFEMLAGARPFDGDDVTETIAAIVRGEPNWKALPATTPANLRGLIEHCLVKDRAERLADMSVVRYVLNERPAAVSPGAGAATSSRRSVLIGFAAGLVLASLAAVAWIATNAGGTTPAEVPLSLTARLPAGLRYVAGIFGPAVALSPDGRTIAFAGDNGKDTAIYLRKLGEFDPVKVPGSDGGRAPFFSTDGQQIAFRAGNRLQRLPVGGGDPVTICEAPNLRGAAWIDDDTIVYTPHATAGLMRVTAKGGGTPAALTTLDAGKRDKTHRTPVGLPGGRTIVFVAGSNEIGTYDEARIVALSLETGKLTELVAGGYAPAFSPTGHLLYVRDATVFALPFDPVTLKKGTTPIPVVRDVATYPDYGMAEFALSRNGVLVYATGGDQREKNTLALVDRQGTVKPLPVPPGPYTVLDLSRDGKRLAYTMNGANNTLWTYDFERSQPNRVTLRYDVDSPAWLPDGKRLAYWTGQDLRIIAADRGGDEQVLITATDAAGRQIFPAAWSDDSQKLVVTIYTLGKGRDVAVYSPGDQRWTSVADTRFNETAMGLTPDGKWVAFVSDKNGREEVFVRAADGTGETYPVSNDGGFISRWTREGRELIYAGDRGPMSVSFTPGAVPKIAAPQLLFDPRKVEGARDFVAAPNGQTFVAVFGKPPQSLNEIRVLTNWIQSVPSVTR
jgi:serine/threonine-protein kinase